MRLSEAILLGDSLKKPDSSLWLNSDGSCGCAFGGALLAAGINHNSMWGNPMELDGVLKAWPWLDRRILAIISEHYERVVSGKETIEQLVDYVSSVEPPDSPEHCEPEIPHDGSVIDKAVEQVKLAEENAKFRN